MGMPTGKTDENVFILPYDEKISFLRFLKYNNLDVGQYRQLQHRNGYSNRVKCKYGSRDGFLFVDFYNLNLYDEAGNVITSISSYDDKFTFVRERVDVGIFYKIEKEN